MTPLTSVPAAHGWLVAATALHAGFQVTVTVLVYPALLRVRDSDWSTAHATHSRAITPLVAVVYGGALAACVLALLSRPDLWVWLAATATVLVFAATGLVAAPTHGRLAAGRTDALVRRLLLADRCRLVGALLALAAALLA